MRILGITGSYAMGKSVVTGLFARCGAKTISADALVHQLLQPKGRAFVTVSRRFPAAVRNGVIERKILGDLVFSDDAALRELEAILHPLVAEEEKKFVLAEWRKGARLFALDIPLLFETEAEHRVHQVIVASAPAFIQKQRALQRLGMNEARLKQILKRQLPDARKRQRADCVIYTGLGKAYSMRQIKNWISQCAK